MNRKQILLYIKSILKRSISKHEKIKITDAQAAEDILKLNALEKLYSLLYC